MKKREYRGKERRDQFRRKLPPKILPAAATGAVRVTRQSEGEREVGRGHTIRQGEREERREEGNGKGNVWKGDSS